MNFPFRKFESRVAEPINMDSTLQKLAGIPGVQTPIAPAWSANFPLL